MKYFLFIIVVSIVLYGCVDENNITENETENAFVKIISPNGGEVFSQDSSIVLSWEYNKVDSIIIFISYDGGNSWESDSIKHSTDVINQNIKIEDSWRTSDSCLFKIENTANPEIFDISDSLFAIVSNKSSFVKMISPNGGEIFSLDSTIVLSWEYYNVDSIRIYISYDGGNSWNSELTPNIVPTIINQIEIKSFLTTSETCLFKIESTSISEIFDVSDAFFSILNNNYSSCIEYLQFKEGNFWIYEINSSSFLGDENKNYIEKTEFDGISKFDNIQYYRLNNTDTNNETYYKYYRIDSSNGTLFNSKRRETILSLAPGYHKIESSNDQDNLWINVSDETIEMFGENIDIRHHNVSDGEVSRDYYFSKEYGIVQYNEVGIFGKYISKAIGCFIDNSNYGDTTFSLRAEKAKYLKYYPLSVGNNWSFNYYEINMFLDSNGHGVYDTIKTSIYHRTIKKDTLINNLRYFVISNTIDDSSYSYSEYERIDSVEALVYRYNKNRGQEILIDKLNPPYNLTYHDTYRFYNENVISTDIKHAFSSDSYSEYDQTLIYGAENECVKEIYDYRLERDVGLSNLRAYECGETTNLRWEITILELFDYAIAD